MTKKRLLLSTILVVFLLFALSTSVVALPSSQLFETYATGVDSEYEVYGNIWYGQTFTVSPESHSAAQLRILAYREGSPGTVTISIKEVDGSGLPTGADLTSGTFDGDIITTDTDGAWYGVILTEDSLDYGEVYGIVIRAEAGDVTNSLHVRYDGSTATYADGSEVTSVNGGISWTADADDDLYFEVRGCELIELTQAKVFRGYIEDGDMLFAIQYYNSYTPYYPIQGPHYYFTLQLRAVGGATVLAQTPCIAWGYKPGAIYLNADTAAGLTEGAAYRLYIYGDLTEEPIDYFTLTTDDWYGGSLLLLDSWVLTLASDMEVHYSATLTTYGTDSEVLNTEGGVIFATGIPGLESVRPNLFQTIVYDPGYTATTPGDDFDTSTDWETQIGTEPATAITGIASIFGLEAVNMAGFMMLGAYLALCLLIVMLGGEPIVAALLGIPFIIAGTWLRIIPIAFIAIIAAVAVLMMVYRFWWSRT